MCKARSTLCFKVPSEMWCAYLKYCPQITQISQIKIKTFGGGYILCLVQGDVVIRREAPRQSLRQTEQMNRPGFAGDS